MSAVCAIIAALLMIGASGWMCYRIWTRKDPPLPITTWIIFSLVVPAVALAAVLQTGLWRWGNAQTVVDSVSVACVLGFMLWTKHYRFGMTKLELWTNLSCIAMAGVAMSYWYLTSDHHYASLALQSVMVVSYVPLWCELSTAKTNPYRYGFWFALMALSVISFYPAYRVLVEKDESAQLWYAGRATGSTLSVLLLMWRLDRRERNAK